jgi:hypothetical protein
MRHLTSTEFVLFVDTLNMYVNLILFLFNIVSYNGDGAWVTMDVPKRKGSVIIA